MTLKKICRWFAFLAFFSILLLGCHHKSTANKSQNKNVKIAVVGSAESQIWQYVAKKAKKENINLKVVEMTDYIQPNVALDNGSVDMNAFQHGAYLKQWNKDHHGNLVSIGQTFITPLYIFSNKISNLKNLPQNAKVVIPIETAIQGRSLLAFETAGVIKLKPGVETKATIKDVIENPKNIKFVEVESASAPRVLKEVDAAVIGGGFASDAGMDVDKAIFTDADYIDTIPKDRYNIIAVKEKDKNNKTYKQIVKLYQSDDVISKMKEVGKGQFVPVWKNKLTQ